MTTSEEQPHDTATTTDRAGQLTAGNKAIGVNGIPLFYRRFGDDRTNAPPQVLLQRFRGNLDSGTPHWSTGSRWTAKSSLLDNRGVRGVMVLRMATAAQGFLILPESAIRLTCRPVKRPHQ